MFTYVHNRSMEYRSAHFDLSLNNSFLHRLMKLSRPKNLLQLNDENYLYRLWFDKMSINRTIVLEHFIIVLFESISFHFKTTTFMHWQYESIYAHIQFLIFGISPNFVIVHSSLLCLCSLKMLRRELMCKT